MRLILTLQVKDLTYCYSVAPSVISKEFSQVIVLVYENLIGGFLWPSREQLLKSMPNVFRENFGFRIAAIIDCFEIFIERPSNH